LVSWQVALDLFEKHPLLGAGVGAEQAAMDEAYKEGVENPEFYIGLNAHNYYLYALMTFGICGFLLLFFFWIHLFRMPILYKNTLLTNTLVLFLLCSTTEVMLVTQKGIVFLYLFYSMHLVNMLGSSTLPSDVTGGSRVTSGK
jgi:O-antigen ligase